MKARTFVTAALVGLLLLSVSSCTDLKERVIQSQKERNWLLAEPSAISSAQEPIEPVILPKTHFAAGLLFEQQGQIDKAIIQYRKAVAVSHDYVQAHARLGILLGMLGRHTEAEASLRRAVQLEPDSPALRNNLGYEYALQGRWTDAEAELNNAIRLQPDFARAYVNLGMVLSKMGRFEEALEAFNAVLPEPDAFYNLGLMFTSQHRYHDAADAFRHVLSLNPEFAAAQRQLDSITPKLEFETPLEPQADVPRIVAEAQTTNEMPPAKADTAIRGAATEEQAVAELTVATTELPTDTRSAPSQDIDGDTYAAPSREEELARIDDTEAEPADEFVGPVLPADTATDTISAIDSHPVITFAAAPDEAVIEGPSFEIAASDDTTGMTPCPEEDLAWIDYTEAVSPAETIDTTESPVFVADATPTTVSEDQGWFTVTEYVDDTGETIPCPDDEELAWFDYAEADQPIQLVEADPPTDTIEPTAPEPATVPAVVSFEPTTPIAAIDESGVMMAMKASPEEHLAWINGPESEQPITFVEATPPDAAIEVVALEPVVFSVTAEQALADVLSEIIIPAIEWPAETIAELTSAERTAAGRAPEDYPPGMLSAPPMPFWPGTYDPCEFADDAVWFEPLEPAWAPQTAFAPAWYTAWGDVVPTTVTVPTTDMDLPGWISMADADRPPHQAEPRTDWPPEPPHFYTPLPELSMDEFAGWPEPNPPDDMIK